VDSPQSDQSKLSALSTAEWFAEHVQPHEAMLRAWLAQGFGPRLAVDAVVQEAFLHVLRARETGELQAPKALKISRMAWRPRSRSTWSAPTTGPWCSGKNSTSR